MYAGSLLRYASPRQHIGGGRTSGVASREFNEQLRRKILKTARASGGENMFLAKDPVFADAVMMPKLMAIIWIR